MASRDFTGGGRTILTVTGPTGQPVDLIFDDLAKRSRAAITYLDQDMWNDAANDMFSYLESVMARRFETEGEYGGNHWQPNSPPYAYKKHQLRGHARVGEDTGELKQSLTERNAAGAIRRVIDHGVEFGTSVGHARDFNDGVSGTVSFPYGGWQFSMDGTPAHDIFSWDGIPVDAEIARRLQRVVIDKLKDYFGPLNRPVS